MTEYLKQYKYYDLDQVYNNKVLIVTLNRPPVNAFIKESYEELSSIVSYANNSQELCALILQSKSKHFSAGADVKQLGLDGPQEAAVRRAALRKAGFDFYTCGIPVIAAVNGAAVGAGAVFSASADIVIASKEAHFSIPEIDVGVVGGAKGLGRLFPPQKIRTMALTGMKVSAEEAHRLGGIEAVVPLENLHEMALEYAKIVADKGVMAVRKWKEALLVTESVGPREGLLIEQCLSQELGWFSPKPTIK